MNWQGETKEQRERRTAEWHRVFCWVPRQLADGRWVWLEHVWLRRVPTNFNNGYFWLFAQGEKSQPVKELEDLYRPKPSGH